MVELVETTCVRTSLSDCVFAPGFAADPISECFSITHRVKDAFGAGFAGRFAVLDPAPDREKISANIGAAARSVARAHESPKEPAPSRGRDRSPRWSSRRSR
ncbi:hypothetical protein GCM10010197_32840 [Nocardioides luteus]|uniref:Uncharacterized protein n=1 Tax=Nocardioides luteus TaxID=1844 RepID=A0ABQ5SRG5_9ACTN|nr:hypothetical protein GCM10010197_32840 [Nocardioides luteus]GLJ66742.1 hypothetical protein GCM10017579_07780 [Nocardioides luteus]